MKTDIVKIKRYFYQGFYRHYSRSKGWVYGKGKTPKEAANSLNAKLSN